VSDPFRTNEPVTAFRAIFAPVTLRFLIFAAVTAFARIFAPVTALALICAVPTEFGASAETAATLVPVRATRSARHATTMAGDGR
jgi:hypothetical protein